MLQGRFGFTYQVSAEFKAPMSLTVRPSRQSEHTAATDAAFPHGKTRPFKQAFFFDAASSQRALRAPKPDSAPR